MFYALIDCNNFYASCERVFNPKLKNKAVVVLSNNDGCAIARSNEAKALGVKMGHPAFELKKMERAGQIEVLSGNFTLYGDMSNRVMQTIASLGFEMEIYSIDETFLLLLDRDLEKVGKEIRDRILKWTGIPVSVGIAKTKTLAKIAGKIAKKTGGVHVLKNPTPLLEKWLLKDVWGIGKKRAERLKKSLVITAFDLVQKEDLWIRKKLGIQGLRTALELRGTPSFTLENAPSPKKSILCSRSFSQKIGNLKILEEEVSKFGVRVMEKLRKQKQRAGSLTVFIATSPFDEHQYTSSCSVTFPLRTNFTPDAITCAKKILRKIYRKEFSYKRAGILLTDLGSEDAIQKDLFEEDDPYLEKKRSAMQAVDRVNKKYDKEALFFLAEGLHRNFRSQRKKASPKYTTSWEDIPIVQSDLPLK